MKRIPGVFCMKMRRGRGRNRKQQYRVFFKNKRCFNSFPASGGFPDYGFVRPSGSRRVSLPYSPPSGNILHRNSYYPFVIGKHKELADYVLDYKTVSRFHLRLDRTEDKITVTDLNSTNGTTVAGVLLAVNETAELNPGDEVRIADLRFVWK